MTIEPITVGPFAMNAHLVYDKVGGQALLIDPGDEVERLLRRISELKLTVLAIVFTHGHIDHVAYAEEARQALGVETYLHPLDWDMARAVPRQAMMFGLPPMKAPTLDRELPSSGTVEWGPFGFEVRHTPGHSPGSVVLIDHESRAVLVGDLVFAGSVGRTDLPGCSTAALNRSIVESILPLPDDYRLYPGHGPTTTVGEERRSNPFVAPLARAATGER